MQILGVTKIILRTNEHIFMKCNIWNLIKIFSALNFG
jgi:hypothetical protein